MLDLVENVFDNILVLVISQLFLHSPQRHTDNIAMMQFRSSVFFTHLQPDVVHQIHILRPQPRRMQEQLRTDQHQGVVRDILNEIEHRKEPPGPVDEPIPVDGSGTRPRAR